MEDKLNEDEFDGGLCPANDDINSFEIKNVNQAINSRLDIIKIPKVKTEFQGKKQRQIGSRRITLRNDDRTVFPRLMFDTEC